MRFMGDMGMMRIMGAAVHGTSESERGSRPGRGFLAGFTVLLRTTFIERFRVNVAALEISKGPPAPAEKADLVAAGFGVEFAAIFGIHKG
jgi:hypothetical protein